MYSPKWFLNVYYSGRIKGTDCVKHRSFMCRWTRIVMRKVDFIGQLYEQRSEIITHSIHNKLTQHALPHISNERNKNNEDFFHRHLSSNKLARKKIKYSN